MAAALPGRYSLVSSRSSIMGTNGLDASIFQPRPPKYAGCIFIRSESWILLLNTLALFDGSAFPNVCFGPKRTLPPRPA